MLIYHFHAVAAVAFVIYMNSLDMAHVAVANGISIRNLPFNCENSMAHALCA